ncbi:hypothetical protein [Gemmiger sp.]|uniref:hypothetical protein n=1 Tax=Gemmiger sp. TaxID=2049027 RepID=UPI003AB8D9AE
MKIIEAIQEAYGPEYTTLEDAIHWWSGPRAWREDFTAVLTLKSGKRPHPAKTVWDSAVACRTAADGAQRLRRVVW